MSTRAPAVQARQLVKTYPGDVAALSGLDITVEPGTVFGLLGPNGAGKSTTVKILTTLARPDSGTATVAGHDVLRHPDRVRRAIGVVAQKSGADPVATGRENLQLQGRLYGLRGADLNRRVTELLDRFRLSDAAGRQVKGYSGGMQRRLDVALGLVHRPEVLFLDEPTTGLDPEARTAMWDEITRLAGDEGLSILLTTHYLEEADRLAERIAVVDRGHVVVEGTPTASRVNCAGTPSTWSCAPPSRTRAARCWRARSPRCPVCARPSSTAGASVSAPTTGRPPCPRCSARWSGRA